MEFNLKNNMVQIREDPKNGLISTKNDLQDF